MAAKAATSGGDNNARVELLPLNLLNAEIRIEGITELICHAWSAKAKGMMLDKQTGRGARAKKEPKDPLADYEAAFYRLPDGAPGHPAVAFKAAIVDGCRIKDGLPMTRAKTAVRVHGEGPDQLVRIVGEPRMREDMVRLETGVADIRYRPGFLEWSATLAVTFNADVLSLDSLFHLVDAGGQGGVGEWRPSAPKSKTGIYGMFRVIREGN